MCCIVIDLQVTIIAVTQQRSPSSQCVTNRYRRIRFLRELDQRFFQPLFQRSEQRSAPCIADFATFLWRSPVDVALDRIKCTDAFKRFCCDRRLMGDLDIVKLPAPKIEDRVARSVVREKSIGGAYCRKVQFSSAQTFRGFREAQIEIPKVGGLHHLYTRKAA